jgi:hypothetical protein
LYTQNAGKSVRFSSAPVQTQVDVATLNAAWKQYVIATYHVGDPNAYGGCQPVSGTLAQQETVVTSAEANYTRSGAQVVHVDWTKAPGQTMPAATPPPAPAAVAAAPPKAAPVPASPARPSAAPAASSVSSASSVPAAPASPAPSAVSAASSSPSMPLIPGAPWISCSSGGGAGIDTYLTGVFQTTRPIRHLPNGGNLVDQSILDDFYAYLKQKGYNFKPGSNYGCDVSPTEAAAKAAQHKRAYEGGGCSTCGKIVETDWKDNP